MTRLSILLAFALVGCTVHVYEQGSGHDHGNPNTGGGILDAGVWCSSSGDDGGCDQGYGADAGIEGTNDGGGWNNDPPDGGSWNNYPPDGGGWHNDPPDADIWNNDPPDAGN